MPRRLSEPEKLLWEAFARQIRPLKPAGAPPAESPSRPAVEPSPPASRHSAPGLGAPGPGTHDKVAPLRAMPAPAPPSRLVEVGRRQPGLDDTSWRTLANGRLRPQRTLDLHGRSAQAAFAALHGFLLRAQSERLRCVEIITGVGSGQEGGVLRRELPFWLSRHDLRPLVLAAVHPHPGNAGSVRLLLRRGEGARAAGKAVAGKAAAGKAAAR